MNITMLVEMAADAMGDRMGFGTAAEGVTYRELAARAPHHASVLVQRGSERLVYIGINGPEVPQLLTAAASAGIPFAPLNYRLDDERLTSILARTAPSLAVVADHVRERISGVEGVDVMTVEEFLAESETTEVHEAGFVDPEDVAIWLFTSGTSGEPKAALLRHCHLTSYVLSTTEFMSAGEDEASLVSVPPYHIAGVSNVLTSMFSGRRVVYVPQFDPVDWVRTAAAESVTHAMVVPTMLARILDAMEASGEELPALRHLSYGGGRMPLPVIERAMSMLSDVAFVNAYGLTETSSTVAILGPDDHREAAASNDPAVRARLGSVGRPLPTVELEIRDPLGNALPLGEKGEIYVRGEQVAGEYEGRSALTDDGWFPTNDGGWLDEGGFLFVEGRLDDVIVRGGENLSPGEIEDVLLQHDAVVEAGVIGVPDVEWGEAVAAVVVLRHGESVTEDELKEWVRSHLRSSKVPSIVDFRSELPYNDTHKLLRRVLKAELTRR